MVNSLFKEPMYQILEKIKNEPFSSGLIGWVEIRPRETKAFTAIIIEIEDIPRRIVGPCVITSVCWRRKGNSIISHISLWNRLDTQEVGCMEAGVILG